jgi:hypothetical protein
MSKTKLIEWGISKLSPIIISYNFQTIGMLIVQPQGQALKVFKHFILTLQEENTRVTRIIIHNDKNIPLIAYRVNPRETDSVHVKQLSGLLSHHDVNQRMGNINHRAMMTRGTKKVTLKLEQEQSLEKA